MQKKRNAFIYRLKHGKLPEGVTEKGLDDEINKEEGRILAYERDLSEGNNGQLTGVAFVSFQREEMKQELLRRFKVTNFQRFKMAFEYFQKKENKIGLFLNNQRVYLSQASEPSDVYWKNLHLDDKERYLRKLAGYGFTVFLLVLCATMIYFLLIEQNKSKIKSKSKTGDSNSEMEMAALTALLAISIVVINKILGFLIPCVAS